MTTPKPTLQSVMKQRLYELMDSFLVEGDKPRPIDRLNQDRHLFVENITLLFASLLQSEMEGIISEDEKFDMSTCHHDEVGHKDWDPDCGCSCGLNEIIRNDLRASQRAKLKEMIKSLEK